MKAFVRIGAQTWQFEGEEWTSHVENGAILLHRHKPGTQAGVKELVAVVPIEKALYIFIGDEHPQER